MADNSDYTKPHTNIFKLLPDVFKTLINKHLSHNTFNRYLTKNEMEFAYGSVGKRNTSFLEVDTNGDYIYHDTRIEEPTVIRQAWQLQPILYSKVATIDHAMSWEDVENELENTGVDIDRSPKWGNALQFNWVPPIDADKLVNFRNYYWYDPTGSIPPDYITIKNLCRVYEAQYNEYYAYATERLADPLITPIEEAQILATLSSIEAQRDCTCNGGSLGWDIGQWDDNPENWWFDVGNVGPPISNTYTINGVIVGVGGTWTVSGNHASEFVIGEAFVVQGNSGSGDGTYTIVSATNNGPNTDVVVNETIPALATGDGSLIVDGTLNVNGAAIPGGGWTTATPPPGPRGASFPQDTFFWFNLETLEMKIWSTALTDWIDYITPPATGLYPWDFITGCQAQTDPWSAANKWYHRKDVPDINHATPAAAPIIEYHPRLQLNEWVYLNQIWLYRANVISDWEQSDTQPTLSEMTERYQILFVDIGAGTIIVPGNKTALFVPGFEFSIENEFFNVTHWNTVGSFFNGINTVVQTTNPPLTISGIVAPIIGGTITEIYITDDRTLDLTIGDKITIEGSSGNDGLYTVNGFLYNIIFNRTEIQTIETLPFLPVDGTFIHTDYVAPFVTSSKGDSYFGFVNQWVLQEIEDPVPVNHQVPATTTDTHEFIVSILTPVFDFGVTHYLANTNAIRVYVDDIRQYGNYVEGNWDGFIFTPAISTTLYANAIAFLDPSSVVSTVVRVELGVAADLDIGYDGIDHNGIPVRTTTDVPFIPEYKNLAKYRQVEQIKQYTNQYPLFDLFNIDGTTAYLANEIFRYVEDQNLGINTTIGKRIVTFDGGRDYLFEQLLLTEDGGMYCFKDGDSIEVDNLEGLQTIWRKGTDNEQYVPRYINQYRLEDGDTFTDWNNQTQTALVPAGKGAWEVPNQLFYNADHENRQQIRFTQLFTHFKSIMDLQVAPDPFNFPVEAPQRLLSTYNYGVGGTIREYNDSYDTFLSSAYSTTTTPQGIFTFAATQYDNNLTTLSEIYLQNLTSYLTTTQDEFLIDLETQVSNATIDTFEQNKQNDIVFGDTTAYNATTNEGIKGWIATSPILNLTFKTEPAWLVDPEIGLNKILHHDGHYDTYTIDDFVERQLIVNILNITGGTSTPTIPPYTAVSPGLYWQNSVTKVLYRFIAVSVGIGVPALSYPEGTYWFNTATNLLMFRDPLNIILGWSPVTGTVGDVDAAWRVINLEDILNNIILEAERRLYQIAPDTTTLKFDFQTQMFTDLADQTTFQQYMKEAYYVYVRLNALDPFATDFNNSDAFTWNYRAANTLFVVYPTAQTNLDKPWGARWEQINLTLFGTPYPHLEPWKIQRYTGKPTWWDLLYKDITNTRRWNPLMWSNLNLGIIPVGELLPDGVTVSTGGIGEVEMYTHFSVNIYATTIDGYAPDDLIPPFYSNDPTLTQQALVRSITYLNINEIDDIYEFGDVGPTEQQWQDSTQFYADLLGTAYRMQPVRFLHYTWGTDFTIVAGLQIDMRTSKVFSHLDTIFHGDLLPDNTTYFSDGINQWYINFIRYGNYDVNTSDFKPLWTQWHPQLTYLTDAMVDVKSLDITNKFFDITKNDYQIILKKSPGVENFNVESFQVTTDSFTTYNIRHNSRIPRLDGTDWTFRVTTPSPLNRSIDYYGVKKYSVSVDQTTDTFTHVGILPWSDIDLTDKNLTWFTGKAIFIESTESFPAPILSTTPYYLIKVTDSSFKLATSQVNANLGIYIDITTVGSGTIFVSDIKKSFVAVGGFTTQVWKEYHVDTRTIIHVIPPFLVTGIQTLLDIIYGYIAFEQDLGFVFSDSSITEVDISSNRPQSWQVQIEGLLNAIYTGLGEATVAILDQAFGAPTTPSYDVNPFKNNLWFRPPYGIVSNIISGPFSDIRTTPSVYTQISNPIAPTSIFALREDKLTHIYSPQPVGSNYEGRDGEDAVLTRDERVGVAVGSADYMGGARLFIDTYEHIILFNDYTTEENLIYDPFLGLNTAKFTLTFYRSPGDTRRPNIGGYFLLDNQFIENIEVGVDNMQKYYDTYVVNETANFVGFARDTVGYEDPDYLDELSSVTEKSKFLFWKGLIQNKGTVTAVKAFVNSRLFVDAFVDEFWAYKIAEYGDSREKIYPELKVFTGDVRKNEMRLHFTSTADPVEASFIDVKLTDKDRWYKQPEQRKAILETSVNGNLYFDAKVTERIVRPLPIMANSFRYIQLDNPADGIRFTFTNGTDYYEETAPSAIWTIPFTYIPGANNIEVRNDNTLLKTGIDYLELSPNTIQLLVPLVGVFSVQKRTGILVEDIHYEMRNSKLIKVLLTNLQWNGLTNYTIYLINVYKNAINPIKLIDYKSQTTLAKISVWDPGRGYHYANAYVNVDLSSDTNPALYTNNLDQQHPTYNPPYLWNSLQVGTTWWDTSNLDYVPYWDHNIFTLNERSFHWGRLADWSTIDLYEWTQSNVPPTQWASAVSGDENDTTLLSEEKRTGEAFSRLYVRYLNQETNVWGPWVQLDSAPYQEYVMELYGVTQTLTITDLDVVDGNVVDVYVNGFFVEQATVEAVINLTPLPDDITKVVNITTTLDGNDIVRIINPLPEFTDAQLGEQELNTSTSVQYTKDYPYSTVTTVDNQGNTTSVTYFFWVRNKTTLPEGNTIPINQVAIQLKTPPQPYMFQQNFIYNTGVPPFSNTLNYTDSYLDTLPGYYSQVIINGVAGMINEDDRYKIQFTKDLSLRQTLENSISKKNKHEEWQMIRAKQPFLIGRDLWDKITESLIGYKLNDPLVPVPSIERQLYDETYNTRTRWGLGDEQAFVDPNLAVNTVIKEIEDEKYNVFPVDREVFFGTYSFDTPENIIEAMNAVYTTFPTDTTNRIFFSVLMDAMTLRTDYSGIFKTSYLSLYGIRLFETPQNALDD